MTFVISVARSENCRSREKEREREQQELIDLHYTGRSATCTLTPLDYRDGAALISVQEDREPRKSGYVSRRLQPNFPYL